MSTPDEAWEQRMADRAAARRAERDELEQAEWRRAASRFEAERAATARVANAPMTLVEAVELMRMPPFACACLGGPYCCRFRFGHARTLVRAAHIAIKMVDQWSKVKVH